VQSVKHVLVATTILSREENLQKWGKKLAKRKKTGNG
jgi:hypothetical protein